MERPARGKMTPRSEKTTEPHFYFFNFLPSNYTHVYPIFLIYIYIYVYIKDVNIYLKQKEKKMSLYKRKVILYFFKNRRNLDILIFNMKRVNIFDNYK